MSFCDTSQKYLKTCGRARARDRYEHTAYYAKQTTSSKATRTSSRNPQGPPRTGSADTPTSNGTSVKTKKSTAVRSSKKSATVPKQLDVKVNLSYRVNTYVAPHSRALAVSRANGNGGGLRTYSRIPLHLRGKTPGAADAVIDSTKSNHATIANREKNSTDQTV